PRRSRPLPPPLPRSPFATRHAPLVANRLGLALNVREEGRVVVPLQSLLDEGPEHDLKTDRELERDRRPSRKDPSSVQGVLGENEEDSGLVVGHQHLRTRRLGPPPSARCRLRCCYIIYNVIYIKSSEIALGLRSRASMSCRAVDLIRDGDTGNRERRR